MNFMKKIKREITVTKNKGSLHNTDLGRRIRKIKLNKNEKKPLQ